MPMTVVHNSLEGGVRMRMRMAWVDTDVDKDDVLIVSEGRVKLAAAKRVRLTCERNSMSCMEHGTLFSFTTACYTTPWIVHT